ncbi:hypothetical protein HID58_005377 [Brassica napus]|uniref:Uncharacterized protein n=1 Tax=Brassica napus TaxID=3708 RepID=A0ABQ8E8H0_BRANA|nr:hypothetical protein HID58_005377 [Brassica napus]
MGCNGSRLGGAAAARTDEGGVVPLPAGIRPLLRRRLEEMKKRSHASVLKGNQTLSKKELLRHGSSEVDDGEEMEEKHDSLKLSAKVAPVPDHHVEEKKEVIYEKISSRDEKDAEDTRKSMESESVLIESKEDESIVKKEKRERKGKRFGIALPRKYLANVTAGCMGNHTHARLMQEKSSQ